MSEKKNEFKEWMDSRGLKTKDVAAELHVDEATIRNWRSQGVPPRREPHVRKYMMEWKPRSSDASEESRESELAALRQNLVIYPTKDQFNAWNRAAMREGKLICDWAAEGLDALAAEEEAANGPHSAHMHIKPVPTEPVVKEPTPKRLGKP